MAGSAPPPGGHQPAGSHRVPDLELVLQLADECGHVGVHLADSRQEVLAGCPREFLALHGLLQDDHLLVLLLKLLLHVVQLHGQALGVLQLAAHGI